MAKSNRSTRAVAPVPWQQFVLGFEAATGALEQHNDRASPKPFMADPRGRASGADPRMLVLQAAITRLGQDRALIRAFSDRFWALMDLIQSGNVSEWMLPETGEDASQSGPRLHPALLLAAAEVRMTRTHRFPIRRFRARVEEIIRTEGH